MLVLLSLDYNQVLLAMNSTEELEYGAKSTGMSASTHNNGNKLTELCQPTHVSVIVTNAIITSDQN